MHVSKFEDICRQSGLAAVAREKIDGYDVYIADGVKKPCKDHPQEHFRTLYAVGRGEELELARPLIFDKHLISNQRQEHRINSAIKDASETVQSLNRVRNDEQ